MTVMTISTTAHHTIISKNASKRVIGMTLMLGTTTTTSTGAATATETTAAAAATATSTEPAPVVIETGSTHTQPAAFLGASHARRCFCGNPCSNARSEVFARFAEVPWPLVVASSPHCSWNFSAMSESWPARGFTATAHGISARTACRKFEGAVLLSPSLGCLWFRRVAFKSPEGLRGVGLSVLLVAAS